MSRTALIISGIALIAGSASAADADTLEVPAQFPTIQGAINIANPGDTVLVAPGKYLESINLLGKLIAVKSSGGPAVTAIQADQSNPSVISCISGEPSGTFIEGFTIIGGTGAPIQGGGGLLIIKSAATVYECVFAGNSAVQGGGLALIEGELMITGCTFNLNQAEGEGGAIHSSNANLLVDHCTFNSNCAVLGGGVNVHGGTANLSNCDFLENHASANLCAGKQDAGRIEPARGGAVRADNASITIYNGEFFDNTADLGGAVDLFNCTPLIELCDFTGNQASMNGGGVHFASSPLQLERCDFDSNTAAGGGALAGGSRFASASVTSCKFHENCANAGGALLLDGLIAGHFINCLFEANIAAESGGAIEHAGPELPKSPPTFINCTFAVNTAPDNSGSVLSNGAMHIQMFNCILWGNAGAPIISAAPATTSVTYCNVQGGYEGEGNIDADPLFVSPSNRRLASGSPCLDAGDNQAIPEHIVSDIEGDQRIQNDIIDMGAYEGGTCLGDIAGLGNGEVGVDDLLRIINMWGESEGDDPSDINADGVVDVDDLLVIINNWGTCG